MISRSAKSSILAKSMFFGHKFSYQPSVVEPINFRFPGNRKIIISFKDLGDSPTYGVDRLKYAWKIITHMFENH